MTEKTIALKRRIGQSHSLRLELEDEVGGKFVRNFRLCFDFNAITLIEERTHLSLLTGEIWKNASAKTLSIMLWAAVLAHSPEYDSDEGLAVIRSYMYAGNATEIADALFEAFLISLPKDQQERIRAKRKEEDSLPLAPAPATEPASSTSSSSGVSPDTTLASAATNSAG
ncbi:MAG TPA: hypothetical protein VKT80_02895 [Chloroflexota bacterium]|nr:hypothetical protein [Chloroflexota bacterium]